MTNQCAEFFSESYFILFTGLLKTFVFSITTFSGVWFSRWHITSHKLQVLCLIRGIICVLFMVDWGWRPITEKSSDLEIWSSKPPLFTRRIGIIQFSVFPIFLFCFFFLDLFCFISTKLKSERLDWKDYKATKTRKQVLRNHCIRRKNTQFYILSQKQLILLPS